MKRAIVFAVASALSQAMTAFAGPEVPSKQVVAPPPPPPEFFRPNEFDIGAFGTWAPFTGINNTGNGNANVRGWGGGMDFTYWFPWKYAGVRFQGTGLSIESSSFNATISPPGFPNITRTVHVPDGNLAAGVLAGDGLLRLPLDQFWPGVHLAPYVFGGLGGIIVGSGPSASFSATFTETGPVTVTTSRGVTTVVPLTGSRQVTVTGKVLNRVRSAIGTDRVLGRVGGGLEYRFTPNIGIFTEASYNIVNGADNNFVQFNFIGLRYAF
jgi:hypothetical protein